MSNQTSHHSPTTQDSFGFETVAPDERQSRVNQVFSSVASRYDLMNDVLSGGLHRLWKQQMITRLNPPRGVQAWTLLDVAGGTGDIALGALHRAGLNARAVICDISAEMLAAAADRIAADERGTDVSRVQGNAECLPFRSASFDAYTIAFGIRNVTRLDLALAEAYRVLKPGSRFLCLEFSQPEVPVLDDLYDLYSFNVMPKLGGLLAGDEAAYQYLVESIRKFPDRAAFEAMIRAAGFEQVKSQPLSGGIAALHSGWRL